jgi:myo-inositol-1(or 4)-monophosphatase
MTIPDADPHDLLALARRAALEAGSMVSRTPGRSLRASTKSSPTDFVTEMDRASEQLIREIIVTARPDDGLIGEEGSSKSSQSGISWLIDPIDGTTNYLRGIPDFSVSIAAVTGDGARVGVVYDPTLGETFSAIRHRGATLNDTPITCSATPLAEAIVGTGFGYSPAERAEQAELLGVVLPAVGDIRRPGSAAISLCWVACGRLDAFYEAGLEPWDFAAGSLIAQEAGADVHGGEPSQADGDMIIVSAPSVTAGLRQILARGCAQNAGRKHGKESGDFGAQGRI